MPHTQPQVEAVPCCPAPTREPISAQHAESLALSLKALSDPTRLRLVSLVAAHRQGEACVCDLVEPLELSQGTVSHHLKILVEAGIFSRQKRGTWAYYRLVPGCREAITSALLAI